MDNPLLNTISNSNISKNVNIKNNMSQTNTQLFNVTANLMPSERQTTIGVTNPSAVTKSNNEMKRFTSQNRFSHHRRGTDVTTKTSMLTTYASLAMQFVPHSMLWSHFWR